MIGRLGDAFCNGTSGQSPLYQEWQFVEGKFANIQASCDELLEQTTKSILNESEPQMARIIVINHACLL
jgi:hypothetical protein